MNTNSSCGKQKLLPQLLFFYRKLREVTRVSKAFVFYGPERNGGRGDKE